MLRSSALPESSTVDWVMFSGSALRGLAVTLIPSSDSTVERITTSTRTTGPSTGTVTTACPGA